MFRNLVLCSILCVGSTSASAHCLDTKTVVQHFTRIGEFGLPGFLDQKPVVKKIKPSLIFGQPVFIVPNQVSLGAGSGIDDVHECSMKRALISGQGGLQEH